MTQPTPPEQGGDGGNRPARKAEPVVKVGDVVAYTRTDPFTGAVEELLGVVVRAAEKGFAHLIRPLAHYAHEVDPADVTATPAADSGS